MDTITLYRAVGPAELALIRQADWRAFPPRLPEQPIFHQVLDEAYACELARQWPLRYSGCGYVVRFQVDSQFLERYLIQSIADTDYRELWIPADHLDLLNAHLLGPIELINEYYESSR